MGLMWLWRLTATSAGAAAASMALRLWRLTALSAGAAAASIALRLSAIANSNWIRSRRSMIYEIRRLTAADLKNSDLEKRETQRNQHPAMMFVEFCKGGMLYSAHNLESLSGNLVPRVTPVIQCCQLHVRVVFQCEMFYSTHNLESLNGNLVPRVTHTQSRAVHNTSCPCTKTLYSAPTSECTGRSNAMVKSLLIIGSTHTLHAHIGMHSNIPHDTD